MAGSQEVCVGNQGAAVTMTIPPQLPRAIAFPMRVLFRRLGLAGAGTNPGRFLAAWLWASLSSGFAQILPVAMVPVVARILPFDAFARFTLAQVAILTFLGVANSGLGILATRYASRYAETDPQRLGRVLGLAMQVAALVGLLCSAGLLWFGGAMAVWVYGAPELAPVLRASALAVLFLVVNGYQIGALLGLGEFRAMAVANGLQAIAGIALVAAMAAVWGEVGAVLGIGVAAVSNWAHYSLLIRQALRARGVRIEWRSSWQELEALVGFALPAAASSIIANFALFGANVFLVRSPDGVAQAALFSVCYLVRSAVIFPPTMAQRVCSVRLTAEFGTSSRSRFESLYQKTVIYNAAFGLLAAAAIFPLRVELLALLGPQFSAADRLLAVVLLASVLEIVATSLYIVVPASGRMWLQGAINLVWASVVVAGTAVYSELHGASAVAWAHAAAWTASILLYYAASRYLLRKAYPTAEGGRR